MNPTPAFDRPEWLDEDLLFDGWRMRLFMVWIGVCLWLWTTAWSARERRLRRRRRLEVKGGQP